MSNVTSPQGSCVTLIGMPGAGKSTVGRYLAESLGIKFHDTDDDLERHESSTLQTIMDTKGLVYFRALEESLLLDVNFQTEVIATGGSVIYSQPLMAKLQSLGPVVFLDVPLLTLEDRVAQDAPRGMAKSLNTSYQELYEQRYPLYQQWADITIDCSDSAKPETIAASILRALGHSLDTSADMSERS
jgi:shikimate kinase